MYYIRVDSVPVPGLQGGIIAVAIDVMAEDKEAIGGEALDGVSCVRLRPVLHFHPIHVDGIADSPSSLHNSSRLPNHFSP